MYSLSKSIWSWQQWFRNVTQKTVGILFPKKLQNQHTSNKKKTKRTSNRSPEKLITAHRFDFLISNEFHRTVCCDGIVDMHVFFKQHSIGWRVAGVARKLMEQYLFIFMAAIVVTLSSFAFRISYQYLLTVCHPAQTNRYKQFLFHVFPHLLFSSFTLFSVFVLILVFSSILVVKPLQINTVQNDLRKRFPPYWIIEYFIYEDL